ncbi:MAG TPA: undecaprenyldiphospho-muramoylpentapeptide beta-N-acetylglucosaminyltransferase [Candidatus Acidoferrum sp.]|jgi:UDP-N-acetylglucosamine--N-acetylmuramyl-(pentapeptide) pyrophosphoryl-undecaprenol N-acetylglucosamine transferase|nr:undecaprenyldiphospho-muramoylpentapeptide beta-N-acetylglucosaminyltransferase [Candidatus Acidoferrum sp.]
MNAPAPQTPFVAIACGGTGGHLFPGIAVAGELKKRGCEVGLLISPKEIDQQAVKAARDMEVFTLPAVGLQNRNYVSFALSFWKSYRTARQIFKRRPPQAVLAMGGFTSAPPILAARKFGARTFLHESNTVPGRANRFLASFVDEVFVGFPEAAGRIKARKTSMTGTPVRPEFSKVMDIASCRAALGLEPGLPTILAVGGSQGASGLNEIILSALPLLASKKWQWLHLTGANDFEKVKAAYAAQKLKAVVKPFLAEMKLALEAATVAVSRAGASSLAEIAAVRLPSLLVPFPAAADNHQFFNGLAFEKTGAAKLLEQKNSTPEKVAVILSELVEDETCRSKMQATLRQWHAPGSAGEIAENILRASFVGVPEDDKRKAGLPQPDAMAKQHFFAA